ncbi:MAG: hypothetical protein IJY62_05405 [Clostridia bacterium]|nr:hypothetical protein [Clostridia bacterium]
MFGIKKILSFALAGLFALIGGYVYAVRSVAEEADQRTKEIDVYIMAGQSNMVGTSRLELLDEQYKVAYPRVKIYNGGDGPNDERNKWVSVRPGQGAANQPWVMFGPELGMASILNEKDKEVAFIKYAYGGTAIYQHSGLNNTATNHDNWHGPWDGVKKAETVSDVTTETSGRLYTECMVTVKNGLAALKADGYTPVVKGLAWMQGETDGEIQFNNNGHDAASVYEHNLTELFSHFRSEIGEIVGQDLSKMPIVFGEIYEYSTCVVRVREIVEAQAKVGLQPNNYLIETGDLIIDSRIDDWHWNGNEEYTLGVRFGEKLYEVTHGPFDNAYSDGYEE